MFPNEMRALSVFLFYLQFRFENKPRTRRRSAGNDMGLVAAFRPACDRRRQRNIRLLHSASHRSSIPEKGLLLHQSPSSWLSSWLTVDPRKTIVPLLLHRGSCWLLGLPPEIQTDLHTLQRTCHCLEAELKMYDRQLLLRNLTVNLAPPVADTATGAVLPRYASSSANQSALHIGQVAVIWDQYWKPCVKLTLRDVHVLIDFANVQLSRTNWHELWEVGFPPSFEFVENGVSSGQSYDLSAFGDSKPRIDRSQVMHAANDEEAYDEFVRIGSVQFLGNMTVRLRSRPLNGRMLGEFTVALQNTTAELSRRIALLADPGDNSPRRRRSGLTTMELSNVLVAFVQRLVARKLGKTLLESAKDVPAARANLQDMWQHWSQQALDYTAAASLQQGRQWLARQVQQHGHGGDKSHALQALGDGLSNLALDFIKRRRHHQKDS